MEASQFDGNNGTTSEQDQIVIAFLKAKTAHQGIGDDSQNLTPEEERAEAEFGRAQQRLADSGLPASFIATVDPFETDAP